MEKLPLNQLRLLMLCEQVPRPSIREFGVFAGIFRVSLSSLRIDLIALLSSRNLQPAGKINSKLFMPSFYSLTTAGEGILKEAKIKLPTGSLEDEDAFPVETNGTTEWFESITTDWPRFDTMTNDSIAELADAYLESAKQHDPAVSPADLFFAAARGFGKLGDLRRFVKSFKGFLAIQSREGNYLALAEASKRMMTEFQALGPTIVALGQNALRQPYLSLTGREIPPLSCDTYSEFLDRFYDEVQRVEQLYAWRLPDKNSIDAITCRIEDLVIESFASRNRKVFSQAVLLQGLMVRMIKDMVDAESAKDFDERAGFSSCAKLAETACERLEAYGKIVTLSGGEAKKARDAVLSIIGIIQRLSINPFKNRLDQSEDSSPGLVFSFLGCSFIESVELLTGHFDELMRFRKASSEEAVESDVPMQNLVPDGQLQSEISAMKDALSRIDKNTAEVRYVQLAQVQDLLGSLLGLAILNNSILPVICESILQSQDILREIDENLNNSVSDLRGDINTWIELAHASTKIAEAEKQSFMKQLGEVAKMEGAGQIIASIPLIPGFLEYKTTLGPKFDLNKWTSKLMSLFKKG